MDLFMHFGLVLASVGLIIFLLDYLWKPKLDLPYPKRLPVIGNLVPFMKNPPVMLMSWAESYGDIYCIQLLHKTMVIVSGYEAVHEVFVTKGKELGGRAHTFRHDMISGNGIDIIFQSINPSWKKLRLFVHQNIKQYGKGLGRVEEIAQEMAQQLIEGIDKDMINGVIDPHDNLYLATAKSITSLIAGNHLTLDDPLFKRIIHMEKLVCESLTLSQGGELDVMPWLRYLGNKTFINLSDIVKDKAEIYQMLQTMYKNGNLSNEGLAVALLDKINDSRREESHNLNDDVIQAVIFDVLVGGISSSSASIYVLFLLMASFPKIQQTLYEEIVQCKRGSQSPMSLNDRQNMPYTRACLLELLRYASVAAITIDHTAVEDTSILGHKLPKGTEVYVNLFALHHSCKYWDDPWMFKPERFLGEDGQLVPSDHINRQRLMAFGAGPRVCLGQTFAMSRMFIFATSVIREFEIRPGPGEVIQHDPRKFKMGSVWVAPRVKLSFTKR